MQLPTSYQNYIHKSRYARYRDDLGRRENWDETVARYFDFFDNHLAENHPQALDAYRQERPVLENAVLNLDVMPSMRAMMTAGKALERDNVAGFNCSYVAVDHPRVFDETMYILMCGTGVGFSVERQYVNKLPEIPEYVEHSDTTIVVKDSKRGWAQAYKELIGLLYSGQIPKWDMSKVRPAGERLKTFGGRSSGPEPLEDLFQFTVDVFKQAAGRKLNSIECHDIMCKIGDVVVCGGVRRSALISLSNLSDERIRGAKSGQWWMDNPQRALANNSVAYTEHPEAEVFMKEWLSLMESKSGERGIFNREAAKKAASRSGRRDDSYDFGTNPCSEIILRNKQFCNLTEAVVRAEDSLDDLKEKVRIASILGTLQATLTDFRYLSKEWKRNTEEEEALLGVSLTGIMDHIILSGRATYDNVLPDWLSYLKKEAVKENEYWSSTLNINQAAAITCVKPSGTVSQLVNSASGIHPRYAQKYIRTVRADKKDPLAQMLIDQGFPYEEDFYKPEYNYVFSFPVEAPKDSVTRDEFSALEQLELWKTYQQYWCEHKPSITVYVKDDEWMDVGAWVWRNFDEMSGVSFLPHTDHTYRQAPYQDVSEKDFQAAVKAMPKKIRWEELAKYEETDNTVASQEMACSGGACEIV